MSDALFLELARVVEVNMGDEHFGVNELAREVGLSRSQIHRKLKSITGKSTSQFIREIRLRQAHELLEDRVGTASEIAYKVGFNSSTYFTKCFHDYFGYPPGSVKILGSNLQLDAIMFTDIVGYTVLMDEDQQKAFELLKKNRQVLRPIIEKYNGKLLKKMGDGVLASFPTVTDAVYCAATIHKTCEDHPDLNLRIGIHQGEVVFDGEDVFGSGVNIASRLEPLAPVGGILVSESVHNNLINKKDVESTYVGEKQLKNIKKPVKVYQVHVEAVEPMVKSDSSATPQQVSPKSSNPRKMTFAVAGVSIILLLSYFLYSNFRAQQTQAHFPLDVTDKSIAVLPFKTITKDSSSQYIAEGVREAILNNLFKIDGLELGSHTSAETYRNSPKKVPEIARELGVANILEGSAQKIGEKIRITVQLIDGKTDNHLWSEEYDRDWGDIFVIYGEIAENVAAALDVVITSEEEKVIDKFPTTSVAAYELYIRGEHERRASMRTYDYKRKKAAIALFDQALKVDPNFVLAIAGRGHMYIGYMGNIDSALMYADRAIAVDPEHNRGYGLKGDCYFMTGKNDLALDLYLKAISLPPKNLYWFWYHSGIGLVYTRQNDPIKAIPYLKKSLEMTETQNLAGAYMGLSSAYLNIGDYETAEEYVSKSLEIEVGCGKISRYHWLMQIHGKFKEALQFIDSKCHQGECEGVCTKALFETSWLLGDFEKAEQYWDQGQNIGPGWHITYEIGHVYDQLGRKEEAGEIFTTEIRRLESELVKERHITYLHLSRIYAFKGNRVEALQYLAEYAKRGFTQGWHDFILIDPFFQSLKDDPEFKAIVKQAQEEKAAIRAQVRQMEARGELTL